MALETKADDKMLTNELTFKTFVLVFVYPLDMLDFKLIIPFKAQSL